jgi:hypothetical protein
VCTERFNVLKKRYEQFKNFHPFNVSSIAINEFPTQNAIALFYNTIRTTINNYPLNQIFEWYNNDIAYVQKNKIPENGINTIKEKYNITNFDVALIDGSEFTGEKDLQYVMNSKYILLDDINAYKCYNANKILKNSKDYECLIENLAVRNGFSIYRRRT